MNCTRCGRSVQGPDRRMLAIELFPHLSEGDADLWTLLYPDVPYPSDPPVICWVCWQRGLGVAPDKVI